MSTLHNPSSAFNEDTTSFVVPFKRGGKFWQRIPVWHICATHGQRQHYRRVENIHHQWLDISIKHHCSKIISLLEFSRSARFTIDRPMSRFVYERITYFRYSKVFFIASNIAQLKVFNSKQKHKARFSDFVDPTLAIIEVWKNLLLLLLRLKSNLFPFPV